MKIITLVGLLYLAACSQVNSASQSVQSQAEESSATEAVVYYFGFDIQRITGIPEAQIEDYGCLFKISRLDFNSSLTARDIKTGYPAYESSDVRAKVVFQDATYYIDYNGVAKWNATFFDVDKKKFASHLKPTAQCKPGKKHTNHDDGAVKTPE